MIIFGGRAHYSAIGGIENSLRSLLKVASEQGKSTILVCRKALEHEALDERALALPAGVEHRCYLDEVGSNIFKRCLYLATGGTSLRSVYIDLYKMYPGATVIVRHHTHALAASFAGFNDVRYLIPSLTVLQLQAELKNSALIDRLKIMAHIIVDGWLQRRALKQVNLFVFSKSMESEVRRRLSAPFRAKKIQIVEPGIDPARFHLPLLNGPSSLREHVGLPIGPTLLLFVGRFTRGKGLEYAVYALRYLPKNFILVLVGGGNFEASLRNIIEEEGLTSRVLWVGTTSRVEDYYRASDLFVMPSVTEGFGQTLIEASACGLRSVAFHRSAGVVTATQEMGLDQAIEYVDSLSAKSLAQGILRSIGLTSKNGSEIVSAYVHQRYRWDALLDKLTQ